MTRRRLFAAIFGALIVVYLLGSVLTVVVVRDQLIDAVDQDLESGLELNLLFFNQFESIDDFGEFEVASNETALSIVTPTGQLDFFQPAGLTADPTPAPDLPPNRVIDRTGDHFTVSGTDGGPDYRVVVGQLDDGRFVALSQPLDDVRSTLTALSQVLLLTLFGVVGVLGVVFWLILRASLKPYDDMVDTAQAIAGGDLDRRATPVTGDPEIARLADSLNTMMDRIQESFNAQSAAELRLKRFAADASHELRTPLTTISGYSELYLSGAATDVEAVTKQMTRIHSEAARMNRLVEELLTLARLDQGRGVEFDRVDLATVVDDAVSDNRVAHPDQHIECAVAEDRVEVIGDPDALRQIIVNLLVNAELHAPASTVTVALVVDGSDAVLTVADDGPGMSAEVASHVFDRFYRADEARRSTQNSSGLGLAIVASLIEAHGGTVDLVTEPGSGACFTVRLPRAALAHETDETSRSDSSAGPRAS